MRRKDAERAALDLVTSAEGPALPTDRTSPAHIYGTLPSLNFLQKTELAEHKTYQGTLCLLKFQRCSGKAKRAETFEVDQDDRATGGQKRPPSSRVARRPLTWHRRCCGSRSAADFLHR